VLWLDVDVIDYPRDLLMRLLQARREVVTPHCRLPDGRSHDLNTFRWKMGVTANAEKRFLRDGIIQPPVGEDREYLDAFLDRALIEVDSVGGTVLLVRADLHRDGLNFPNYPFEGYIETEGFARMVRASNRRCWALPQLVVTHAQA
jgi:hypothetical protein